VEPRPIAEDLAPGDRGAATLDWSQYAIRRVGGPDDADFAPAFERLWAEFGARGEMEPVAVIADRLAWDPRAPVGDFAMQYELLVVRRAGEIVAVRDHTAVVQLSAGGPTVAHLSHVVIEPPERGRGLAAWLRALPLQLARRCAAAVGRPASHPIVLVAEMEPTDSVDQAAVARLRSYERAGFRKLDPQVVSYAQPDFRPANVVELGASQSIPLALIVRRVGQEAEPAMPGVEVAAVVEALYGLYAVHVGPAAMAAVREAAAIWTRRVPSFDLIAPTA
jgi:GNAT superfamily N-acetyltransferase